MSNVGTNGRLSGKVGTVHDRTEHAFLCKVDGMYCGSAMYGTPRETVRPFEGSEKLGLNASVYSSTASINRDLYVLCCSVSSKEEGETVSLNHLSNHQIVLLEDLLLSSSAAIILSYTLL